MECLVKCFLLASLAVSIHSAKGIQNSHRIKREMDEDIGNLLTISPYTMLRAPEGSYVHATCTSKRYAPPGALKWMAEGKLSSSSKLTQKRLDNFTLSLAIESVERSDAGKYKCLLQFKFHGRQQTSKTLTIWVTSRGEQGICNRSQFKCEKDDACIFLQYRCDGRTDCSDDSDELECGGDPCSKKYHCHNGRCINQSLVCDFFHNNDCGDWSDELCLIEKHLPGTNDAGKFNEGMSTTLIPQPGTIEGDDYMTWLKTTVYTVIACTVGVVLFISIIVIAVFRVKMKRAASRRSARALDRRRHYCHREFSENSLQRHPESEPFVSASASHTFGNIFVNVNNGVQLVPAAEVATVVESPPPYTEVDNQCSQRDNTPPPPYSTLDRSAQLPLLTNEAGTNTSRIDLCEESAPTSGICSASTGQLDTYALRAEERDTSAENAIRPVTVSDGRSAVIPVNNVESPCVAVVNTDASSVTPESTEPPHNTDSNVASSDVQVVSVSRRSESPREGSSSGNRHSLILNKQSQIIVKDGQIVLADNVPPLLAGGDVVSAGTSTGSGQVAAKQRHLQVREGRIVLSGQDTPHDQNPSLAPLTGEGGSQTSRGQIEVREGNIIFRS